MKIKLRNTKKNNTRAGGEDNRMSVDGVARVKMHSPGEPLTESEGAAQTTEIEQIAVVFLAAFLFRLVELGVFLPYESGHTISDE